MILQTKKLGEVCNVVGGGTPKTGISKYWDGDLCWVTPKDLGRLDHFEISETERKITEYGLKNSSAQKLSVGSVILSSRAPIGYVVINTVPMATNQGCRSFVCGPEIFNKYLYYFLISNTDLLNSLGSGSTFLEVSGSRLKEIEIPLPPLETQKEIVAKLDEKFSKLREAKQLRQEALADTEKILSQTLREIFEEGNEKGWEEKDLEKVAFINPVKSEIKEIPDNTQVSFIPMASVSDISQSIEAQQTKTLGEVRKGYTYFKRGDVILAKVTPCMENGKIAYTENLDYTYGFGSSEFHVIRANEDFVLPKFIYQILRTEDFRKQAKEKMTGTSGLKRVPKEFIEKYKILIPSLPEQQKIVDRLDALSAQISTLRTLQQDQLADLKKLEKAYLREAFRGELI